MNIHFEKVAKEHLDTIFGWLAQDFISEFWGNTQAHKDDIMNFILRKTPSNYADGKYVYWLVSSDNEPFAMLMTIQETHKDDIGYEKLDRLSKTGNTYGLDYMIGNPNFFGKGYGAKTLDEFIDFFRKEIDLKADTFLIDPDCNNPRAKHVYMKAGFEHVCDFVMKGNCSGAGKLHQLLVKKFEPLVSVISATVDDYPLIQNMARFYVYDLSRECGHISSDWGLPEDGLYESFDFKNYFCDPLRRAYLVKVYDEIAGFVLLNQATEYKESNWNMGEFFIIAKFQGQGIAKNVANKIWEINPGKWEISVIPENKKALIFWERAINTYTGGTFDKFIKEITYDDHQPKRVIFTFETNKKQQQHYGVRKIILRPSTSSDIDAMVSLSKAKRLAYEKVQPRFWCYAGKDGDSAQKEWFKQLLVNKDYLMLTAEDSTIGVVGFVIGRLMPAPEVYNPGGLTLMIDDFCVQSETLWQTVGGQLIEAIKKEAKDKGVAQMIIVCGSHDNPKRQFLMNQGLSTASQWFIGGIV